jgi:uncharacterized membrane-anchored protein
MKVHRMPDTVFDSPGVPITSPRGFLESKVPLVTLGFWVIKICATTLGETGGDALSMTLDLGYALSTVVFLGFFLVTASAQVAARRYHPFLYWAVVVATTTVGTTLSDFLDRTAGLGYVWSSLIEFTGVIAVLLAWRLTTGRIEFENIATRTDEAFYWLTILVSNTLGTALGDCVADDLGFGFQRGAVLFGVLIVLVGAAYWLAPRIPRSILFWAAYVLTRPLGATLGDTLTKPRDQEGLNLSRISSSLVLAAAMVIMISIGIARGRRRRTRDSSNGEPAVVVGG